MSAKRPSLGRGLSALLESSDTDVTSGTDASGAPALVGAVASISLDKIEANPFQPRTSFVDLALRELADSIREQGIIQPVTVRKIGYDKYQLISGERRFKASKLAGLNSIPAYIRIANDQAMLEMALVENIQRENLNPLEIALSYKRLVEECSLSSEELSKRVGKDRTTVSNYMRLLKLPAEIQAGIRDNKISMGHARAIINVEDPEVQLGIYRNILQRELSVREVEALARQTATRKKGERAKREPLNDDLEKFQKNLSAQFGTEVTITRNTKGKGKVVIPFSSPEEMKKVLDMLDF
jgi:ParB family chromosome partitioning protein